MSVCRAVNWMELVDELKKKNEDDTQSQQCSRRNVFAPHPLHSYIVKSFQKGAFESR